MAVSRVNRVQGTGRTARVRSSLVVSMMGDDMWSDRWGGLGDSVGCKEMVVVVVLSRRRLGSDERFEAWFQGQRGQRMADGGRHGGFSRAWLRVLKMQRVSDNTAICTRAGTESVCEAWRKLGWLRSERARLAIAGGDRGRT